MRLPVPTAIARSVPQDRTWRLLAAATVVNATGTAMLVATLVLYFTQVVGLSGGHVGLGLTLGGALGLVAGVPLGHLADKRGPVRVLVVLLLAQTIATAAYLLVMCFAGFLVVAVVAFALERCASAVRQGLIARALPDEGRVRARAGLRAVTNAGFGAGSALATVGIAIGTRGAYHAMILVDVVSFPLVALLTTRLRVAPTLARGEGPRLVVLRDRPFLAVTGLLGALGVQLSILDVGLPLWVAGHTDAPNALVGVTLILNCVVVAAFSIRVSGDTDTPAQAVVAARRSGYALLACCALLATSGWLGAAAATAVIVVAMLGHVLGEMLFAAGQWSLSFSLAKDELQGQYQAVAASSYAAGLMAGPLLMAGVVALGAAGWLLFGAAMCGLGLLVAPVVRWATAVRA